MEKLLAEIARLRSHYTSASAHDFGRRQMLDHFERWAHEQLRAQELELKWAVEKLSNIPTNEFVEGDLDFKASDINLDI